MKNQTLATSALMLMLGCLPLLAQPPKCEMCEMMKEKAAMNRQREQQVAELDKLVIAMNGSLGSQKIEAMAAVVTRLVELYKLSPRPKPPAPPPAQPPPKVEPPKEESHPH
ncbi:MAG: hypothetical protein RLZZ214_1481 [Verrucomicrobiota bacterium]|jgi:hypothetical protein